MQVDPVEPDADAVRKFLRPAVGTAGFPDVVFRDGKHCPDPPRFADIGRLRQPHAVPAEIRHGIEPRITSAAVPARRFRLEPVEHGERELLCSPQVFFDFFRRLVQNGAAEVIVLWPVHDRCFVNVPAERFMTAYSAVTPEVVIRLVSGESCPQRAQSRRLAVVPVNKPACPRRDQGRDVAAPVIIVLRTINHVTAARAVPAHNHAPCERLDVVRFRRAFKRMRFAGLFLRFCACHIFCIGERQERTAL